MRNIAIQAPAGVRVWITIKSFIQQFFQFIGYQLLFWSAYTMSLLPLRVLYAIASVVYFIAFHLLKYRYSVVMQNLARSLPEMTYSEIDSIVKGFYKHFSRLLAEIIKMGSISEGEMMRRVRVHNPELPAQYEAQGRSIIVMMGHYGNWECMNILPKHFKAPMMAVYKPLSSGIFDRLIKHFRSRFGMQMLPMQQAARYMLQHKDEPTMYIFIADQSPAAEAKCQLDFMNQESLMFDGAEKLSKATDAVVVYAEMMPSGDGYWDVHFSLLSDAPSNTSSGEITALFARELEATISKSPQYWLWTHRRWKHKL